MHVQGSALQVPEVAGGGDVDAVRGGEQEGGRNQRGRALPPGLPVVADQTPHRAPAKACRFSIQGTQTVHMHACTLHALVVA